MNTIKTKPDCLEVIGVRLFHPEQHSTVNRLFNDVVSGIQQNPGEFVAVSLYGSADVGTDLAMHLYRYSGKQHPEKTSVGIHLADALSSLGLIHHSVWCCRDYSQIFYKQGHNGDKNEA